MHDLEEIKDHTIYKEFKEKYYLLSEINIKNDSLFKKIDNGVRIENTFNIEDKVMFRYNGEIICIYKSSDDYLKMYKKLR